MKNVFKHTITILAGLGVAAAGLVQPALASDSVRSGQESPAVIPLPAFTNGSFETPVVPVGGYVTYSQGGPSFGGWDVDGAPGNILHISGAYAETGHTYPAQAGSQWVDLTGGGSNTATGVAQTFTTTAGATYKVVFWVGNIKDVKGGPRGTTSTVNVYQDSLVPPAIITATNSLNGGMSLVWKKFSVNFTAAGPTTRLFFINGDGPNDNINGLDNIKIHHA